MESGGAEGSSSLESSLATSKEEKMEMSQFTSPYLTWEMKLNNIKMKIFYSSQCVHFMKHIVLEQKIYLRRFFKVL